MFRFCSIRGILDVCVTLDTLRFLFLGLLDIFTFTAVDPECALRVSSSFSPQPQSHRHRSRVCILLLWGLEISPSQALFDIIIYAQFVYINITYISTQILPRNALWPSMPPVPHFHSLQAQTSASLSPRVTRPMRMSRAEAGSDRRRWRFWLFAGPTWNVLAGYQARRNVLIYQCFFSRSLSQLVMSGGKETNMKHFFKERA